MSTRLFIDENINIYTGAEAEKMLRGENDQQFYKSGEGVSVVTKERWKKAQVCEKNHWFVKGIKSGDDRNYHHSKLFDSYSTIKDKRFDSVIEVGCGPFTNARIVAKICNFGKITLLDPMVLDYLHHPFCSYDKQHLHSQYFPLLGKVVRKFFPSAFKRYQSLLSKKTPIAALLSIPGEEIPKTDVFDLVIMVNVIEHCFNAETFFQNLLNITKTGSYLIFEDKLFGNSEIKEAVITYYDAAHPLKVDKDLIDKFLTENFATVYKRVQSNDDFYKELDHPSEDLYYIGRRK